ncbi:hypothetical protein CDAR_195121 [Caerostris darwini]|uniref:Uncharacterized protein n=1 Tax=Caerostris darwini TaxID=1538125 RepID=A0AAV4X8I4_9ARAC|nr:hypothetical protein CDAR_195121 [Caerostris darwini]
MKHLLKSDESVKGLGGEGGPFKIAPFCFTFEQQTMFAEEETTTTANPKLHRGGQSETFDKIKTQLSSLLNDWHSITQARQGKSNSSMLFGTAAAL